MPFLPPSEGGKIVRRQDDEDQAVGMGGDVVQIERAFPLLGAALAEGEQPAEPAIGSAVRGISEQARRIIEIEPRADDEFDADVLGGEMGADDAGKRVAVGDGDGFEPERLCLSPRTPRGESRRAGTRNWW